MKKILILSLILTAALGDTTNGGDFVFQWKSSSLFPNGTVIQAYVGDNVTFPWEFDMTSPKPFNIFWIWNSEDEKKKLVLGSYSQNNFNKIVPERDLEFLPNAGLMLPKVTLADAGVYKIEINIALSGQAKRYTQSAILQVSGNFVFQWKSSSLFPNGTVVQASVGDNVTFPWEFDMTSQKPFNIFWIWNSEDEKKKLVLGSYSQNNFNKIVPERDLEFLPNAGLMLPKVTLADAGLYMIEINIALSGQAKRYTQAAILRVSGDFVFQWKSSSLFPNGTVVQASVGDNVTFPWEFHMTSQKPFNIFWIWNSEDEKKKIVLGFYSQNNFNKIVPERDLEFLPNAGLMLPKVTLADAGVYKTEINIALFGHSKRYTQSAILRVSVQRPTSCVDVQKYDKVSGVHTLIVNGNIPVKVYCDQSTDNGGWTVIQRRQDGTVNFYRNWVQYETGFGDLNGEFWIGLANIHLLTKNKNYKLRIDLTNFDDSTMYAIYNTFSINGAQDSYQLNVGGYSGTAGDSLSSMNKMKFSTYDRDHDLDRENCAERFHGAWWYTACHVSSLNSHYKPNGGYAADGVAWYQKSGYVSFKRVEMKIRP